jgi:PilZ domain
MNENAKKAPHSADGWKSAEVKELERRIEDRHVFTASAEVVELRSGARFCTRTTDLGPGGCFIDTTNPFPVGAKVRVTIRKGKNEFHTPGNVVYSQHGLGMGISFAELDPEQRRALNAWIGELTGEAHGSAEVYRPAKWAGADDSVPSDRAALIRLVRLMITKGILTEAEGSSVLVDPVL